MLSKEELGPLEDLIYLNFKLTVPAIELLQSQGVLHELPWAKQTCIGPIT